MSKIVKYIGVQDRWPELATTGKQSTWSRGHVEERSDAEAAALLATGLFEGQDVAGLAWNPATEQVQLPGGPSAAIVIERTLATVEPAAQIPGRYRYIKDAAAGVETRSNGVRHRPVNGEAVLGTKDGTTLINAAAETALWMCAVPWQLLGLGDLLELELTQTKDAGASTITWFVHFGPLGTIADPHILITPGTPDTNGSVNMVTAANRSGGSRLQWRIESNTSLQKLGNITAANSFGGISGAPVPAPITGLGAILTQPNYLTVSAAGAGAAEGVQLVGATLRLICSQNG